MVKIIIFSLLVLSSFAATSSLFTSKNQTNDIFLGEDWESGIINLGNGGDDMWYWLFAPRNKNISAPLMLWLEGGPGCPDSDGLFFELGPFNFSKDYELVYNEFSWNNEMYLLFIDQPVGVGWSNVKDWTTNCKDEKCVCKNMNIFLIKFFELHQPFQGKPFYVAGESYGGHYVPSIAAYLKKENNPMINIQGAAIGNGYVNPFIQFGSYPLFAYDNKLISFLDYIYFRVALFICQIFINFEMPVISKNICETYQVKIAGDPPRFNLYDITKHDDYDWNLIYEFWMHRDDARKAVGVYGREYSNGTSKDCNPIVYNDFNADMYTKTDNHVKYLLEQGATVMVYQGTYDYMCNWYGDEWWVNHMDWSGVPEFKKQKYQPWYYKGEKKGEFKKVDNFSFVNVYKAGHMVPMNQREFSLHMITTYVHQNFSDIPTSR